MMILIGAGILLVSLCILITYISYWEVFYAVPRPDEDAHILPGGEQYKKSVDRMHALIDEMERAWWEDIITYRTKHPSRSNFTATGAQPFGTSAEEISWPVKWDTIPSW